MDTPSSVASRRARGDRIKLNRHLMCRLAEALGSRLRSSGDDDDDDVKTSELKSQHAAAADFMIGSSGETCNIRRQRRDVETTIKQRSKTCLLPIVDLLFAEKQQQQQGHRVAFECVRTSGEADDDNDHQDDQHDYQHDEQPIILRTSRRDEQQEIEEEEREKVHDYDYSHCSIDGLDGLGGGLDLRPANNKNCHLSVQFNSLSTTTTTSDEIELFLSSLFLLSHCYANDKYKLYNNKQENVKSYVTTSARIARRLHEEEECCCCCCRCSDSNALLHCNARRRRRRRHNSFLVVGVASNEVALVTCRAGPNGQVVAAESSRCWLLWLQMECSFKQQPAKLEELELEDDRFFDRLERTQQRARRRRREQMGAAGASWRRPKNKQTIGRRTINEKKGKSVIDDKDNNDNDEEQRTTTAIAHCDIQAALKYTKKKRKDKKTNGRWWLSSLFFSLLFFIASLNITTTTTRNSVPNLLLVSAAANSSAPANSSSAAAAVEQMMTQTTRAMQEELSRAVMATIMTTTTTTQPVPTSVSRLRATAANGSASSFPTTLPTASPLMFTDYDDDDTLQQLSSSGDSTTTIATTTSSQPGNNNLTSNEEQLVGLENYFHRTVDFARIFAMVAIMIGDICGNSLVILSVVRHSKLRVTTNWFVVSLACADILVALFAMTFNASVQITGRWIFPRWMCDFWNSCDVLASTASILHLCCISIDRYYAIMRPLDYPMKITTRRVCYALAVVWISSALLSYIPIFTGIYTTSEHILWQAENPDQCEFVVNRVYAIVSSSISFWIPCCIMVFTYYKIYQEATRQEKFIYKAQNMLPAPQINHHHHHSNNNQRAKQRRSKSMAITSLSSSSSKSNAKTPAKRAAAQQLAAKQQQQEQQQLAVAASSEALDQTGSPAGLPLPAAAEQQPLTGSAIDINNNTNGAPERPKIVTTAAVTTSTTTKQEDQDERDSNSGQSTPTKRSISKMKREHKAAKTLGIIMGVFILCWLPFFSWYTPQHICGKACDGIIPGAVVTLLFWIGYFNSTLNPIIYAYFNHEFRDAFKKTLQWIFCCCRDLKCLRVSRPNDNQHYNCTYRSTQEIGLVTNG